MGIGRLYRIAVVRIMRQLHVPVAVITFGKCSGVLYPSGNLVHVAISGHYRDGGIEQGCQKKVGDGNGRRVQMRHEAGDHCRKREDDECPWPVEQTAQPTVRPSGRKLCGTYNGRGYDTELAGMSAGIDIMEEQQQDQ